ncbi:MULTISPECIES: hypothetical protein [Bradyrhizobium]|uniref:hypothetical protein n=1 Tax=Bradyrhizobium TaxID=374 RepID=UPI001BAD4FEC|nr:MULTISPECIES: hypothetical protein [Bradyrhizobium]MBR0706063.1 hypothetical protein [Bradyrhizobium liaoningense]
MLQSILDEPLTRDQQQARKRNRKHRSRQLAHVVHGILSLDSLGVNVGSGPTFRGDVKILLFFPETPQRSHRAVPAARAGTNGAFARCRWMNIEKRALLDHAERCRRVANELAHREAAQRLRAMADEYEARATRLDESVSSTPGRNSRCYLEGQGNRQGNREG